MRKVMQKINAFELKMRDEFGSHIFKSKGKPKSLMQELDCFLKEKGLYNAGKSRPRRK
jgi:hypothetical protein